KESREEIVKILECNSKKRLLILGPCSIHDSHSALEYAERLFGLQRAVDEELFLVMRAHVEKPRTTYKWRGWVYDPHLDGSHDLLSGLIASRRLFLDLTRLRVPLGMEFLDPVISRYLDDLVSWGCIGARTSASQTHRQLAASLEMPVGFKNSVDGNVDVAVQGAKFATREQIFCGMTSEGFVGIVSAVGNAHAHVVLRGGEQGHNYGKANRWRLRESLRSEQLVEGFVIDSSHGNSQKCPKRQGEVLLELAKEMASEKELCGLMLESHLHEGGQVLGKVSSLRYGVSVTDPCMGWEKTRELVLRTAELVNESQYLQRQVVSSDV
ncbi:MAG: 3-deoxy-7-phosphoheptulonate synthase, partial [Chlamydiia bacterium]|nr:3-deoxy-7-phosphoheptulonate synthase [Chlamydiia bacterium]